MIKLDFVVAPVGTVTYTMILNYTDGRDSTLDFTIAW